MSKRRLDRAKLLERLERITWEPEDDDNDEQLLHMDLGRSLLALAEIDHEREHALCTSVARHFLGTVPEPDEVPADDE